MNISDTPWRTDPEADHEAVIDATGRLVADCDAYTGHLPTARVHAHARLISAAPDLLAVCEGALEVLDGILADGVVGPCDADCDCILHPLRAAITKAKGGSILQRAQDMEALLDETEASD